MNRQAEAGWPSPTPLPIACDPTAVPAEQRERWVTIGRQLYAAVEEVREVPGGYRFRVPTSSAMLLRLAEYVSNERLCCGFLRFQVEVEPARGPVWLQLTGPEGTRDYLRTVLTENHLLGEKVARVAGLASAGPGPPLPTGTAAPGASRRRPV